MLRHRGSEERPTSHVPPFLHPCPQPGFQGQHLAQASCPQLHNFFALFSSKHKIIKALFLLLRSFQLCPQNHVFPYALDPWDRYFFPAKGTPLSQSSGPGSGHIGLESRFLPPLFWTSLNAIHGCFLTHTEAMHFKRETRSNWTGQCHLRAA